MSRRISAPFRIRFPMVDGALATRMVEAVLDGMAVEIDAAARICLRPTRFTGDLSAEPTRPLVEGVGHALRITAQSWWAHVETGIDSFDRRYVRVVAAQGGPPSPYPRTREALDDLFGDEPDIYLDASRVNGGTWYDHCPVIDFGHPLRTVLRDVASSR